MLSDIVFRDRFGVEVGCITNAGDGSYVDQCVAIVYTRRWFSLTPVRERDLAFLIPWPRTTYLRDRCRWIPGRRRE